MGNRSSYLTEAQLKEHWKQIEMIDGVTVWENKENPNQRLDQYIVRDEPIENNQKLSKIRTNNPFLVNAYTLKKEGFSCQMDHDSMYKVKTPIRLSNLKDIPYPDIFHLYDVCLHGYEQLSKIVGFFTIDEDQIGINERGQAKVWLSNHFQSNKINGAIINESKMVGDILSMLSHVTDHESCGKYPSLHSQVGTHEKITFSEAISKFVHYVRTYCDSEVPTRLSCVNQVGSSKIENWCKTNQGNGISTNNSKPTQQSYTTQAGGGIITNIAPGISYANRVSSQFTPTLNSNPYPNINSKNDLQAFSQSGNVSNSGINSRAGQTIPPNSVVTLRLQNNPVTYPSISSPQPQFVKTTPLLPNPSVSFNSKSFTYKDKPQIKFANNTATFITQQLPQNIHRPLISYTNSYNLQASTPVRSQIPTQTISKVQPAVLGNATPAISQGLINNYNQPLQIVESISYKQPREENRLQQQRVLSQILELKDGGKTVETTHIPVTNNPTQVLKGSETIEWEDYTKKQKLNPNELSNFGRTFPYSFDVRNEKKAQNLYQNKFTPENDGKSSPQFLALLNQIKLGIGKNNSSSDNYSSNSVLKDEVFQGGYGTYQESKYSPNDYIATKYTGGLDPQLHADIQKYNK